MSRLSRSLLSTAGLLLATTLAIIPTKLHAQTNPQPLITTPAKTLPVVAPAISPTGNVPAATATTVPATTKPAIAPTAATTVPATIKPAIAPTTTTTVPTTTKPATGTSIVPATTPAISTVVPTPAQKTPTKPAVAATSQPPTAELVTLTLKLKEKKVYVYKDGKVVANYPVAIGKKGWETPTGEWYVMEKITNPGWTSFKNGSVISPGKKNPLGERWIGFWTDGKDVIGFHGTPDTSSVGKAVSHGCVRMFDKDVKALFPMVKVGTTVKVVNE